MTPLLRFKFSWAPEGRTVDVIEAPNREQAKRIFYRNYPQYKPYKGEVWIEEMFA